MDEKKQDPQEITCTMMFIDMVESSLFSKILPIKEYAQKILSYQTTMKDAYTHFYDTNKVLNQSNPIKTYVQKPEDINLRGDEVFITLSTNIRILNPLDIELAIKLGMYMKFKWLLTQRKIEREPKRYIELGIGLNQGSVAAITDENMNIESIEGYEINYTKRVESFSRNGKYTNVFISEKAKNILKTSKMIFEEHENVNLKGIESNASIFELKEFLFEDIFIDYTEELERDISDINTIQHTITRCWVEQYIVSILFSNYCRKKGDHYKDKILKIIRDTNFHNLIFYKFLKAYFIEDNMILKLKYYQEIVNQRPTFLLARKEIIILYNKLKGKINRIEPLALQVKNYIDELFKYHGSLLETGEKEQYVKILKEINKAIKM